MKLHDYSMPTFIVDFKLPQIRTSLLLGFEFCDFEGLSQIVEVMIFNKLVSSMHTNKIKLLDKGRGLF
jgi:hypothetical protein